MSTRAKTVVPPTNTATEAPRSPPDPRKSVMIGDVQHDMVMSFGLLNELTTIVGGPEQVPALAFDPQVSTEALVLVLAKRDKRGKILNDPDEPVVPYDLDPAIAEDILDWVAAHCLDFFIRRFSKSAHLLAVRSKDLQATGSSLTSSAS